jgi:hypothetical protein
MASTGVSSSGKTRAFGARIRRFESSHPSHGLFQTHKSGLKKGYGVMEWWIIGLDYESFPKTHFLFPQDPLFQISIIPIE